MEDKIYDVIIAGGGFAGILSAVRICELKPDYKILIIEKDGELGGRLRTSDHKENRWSCGLNRISSDLYEFANTTLNGISDEYDFSNYVHTSQTSAGVLSGGKIAEFSVTDFFQEKGAKSIGGLAAKRDWEKVEDLYKKAEEDETVMDQQFSKIWKFIRKNPAAIVMEHFAGYFGVTDIWNSNLRVLKERSEDVQKGMYSGKWEEAFSALLEVEKFSNAVDIKCESQIVNAERQDNQWKLSTAQGEFQGKNLIVAQSPWAALDWLPKDNWESNVLDLALKSRPTSVVVLAGLIKEYQPIPDMVLIPSEKSHMTHFRQKEITFQTAIDFEVSLDAPEVVKAVKRLKRSKKKLMKFVEGLDIEHERLELMSAGWTQSFHYSDRRHLAKLEKKPFNSKGLFFCGDAYGARYSGDENLKNSLLLMCDEIVK